MEATVLQKNVLLVSKRLIVFIKSEIETFPSLRFIGSFLSLARLSTCGRIFGKDAEILLKSREVCKIRILNITRYWDEDHYKCTKSEPTHPPSSYPSWISAAENWCQCRTNVNIEEYVRGPN